MFEPARRLLVSIGLAAATLVVPIAGPAQAQIPYLQTINQPTARVIRPRSPR
jgi:hypothetical protein